MNNKTVLVGVLNWGLGHATRMVPIIEALQDVGYQPVLASDGAALQYLKKRFPHLPVTELPSYGIRYSKRLSSLVAVLLRAPKILRASRAEKSSLRGLVRKYRPAGIISDNRLGFSHPGIPSAYISHQLMVPLPFFRPLVARWHNQFIRSFNQCWVPDFKGPANLSGEMGHSLFPVVPVKYIGALSRFAGAELPTKAPTYRACFILSGPEPQRSLLEKKLVAQVANLPGKYLLIRGLAAKVPPLAHTDNLKVVPFAEALELATYIRSSSLVVSRPGYSSIMDYYFLKNKALLIPTPGQPEQEYLARYLLHRGYFTYVSQERMMLGDDLKKAMKYPGLQQEMMGAENWKGLFFTLFEGE